jgi:hypothetical protein
MPLPTMADGGRCSTKALWPSSGVGEGRRSRQQRDPQLAQARPSSEQVLCALRHAWAEQAVPVVKGPKNHHVGVCIAAWACEQGEAVD